MITVILPTYNRPNKLKRAIESVVKQTYSNFKILVLDNCSSYNTQLVVKEFQKYDTRVIYHRHSTNIGANRNFDYGLKLVDTDYFCFLSDDDYYLPEYFQTAINIFNNHKDIGFFAGEVVYEDEKANIVGTSNERFKSGYHSREEGLLKILENTHPPCWTGIIFRSIILSKTGYIDEQVEGSIDYDFVQKTAVYYPYYICSTIVAKFTVDPNSWGHGADYKYVWPSWIKMIANIMIIDELPLNVKMSFYSFYRGVYKQKIFLYARQHIKHKEYDKALECSYILKHYFNSSGLYLLISSVVFLFQYIPLMHNLASFSMLALNKINIVLRVK